MLFKIAFRNILRNRRRSLMTGSAIAVGAVALLVFGAFQAYVFAGLQTNAVQRVGHLTVFRTGYFLFGAGDPASYGIDDYPAVMRVIDGDPALRGMIRVMTPTLSLFGIAGNFEGGNDAAKTFFGVGVVPANRARMMQWDEFGAAQRRAPDTLLTESDPTRGFIGVGLARILGLCGPLQVPDCPVRPAIQPKVVAGVAPADTDFGALLRLETDQRTGADGGHAAPRIDLLAATAGGAPNIVSLHVSGAEQQAAKELDDNFVAMPLPLAQQLLYGRGTPKVTGIQLQLYRSEDMREARARLTALLKQNALDLDVRDFGELNPFYVQVVNFFGAIFLFIAVVMGVIVLFTVVNTMTMTVLERTNEIGTVRAMGVRRSGIRRQFLVEGWMLGILGASVGVALAFAVTAAVNRAGLTWTPPGNAGTAPIRLFLVGQTRLIVSAWLGLVLVATVAALIPANRAARLPVVDALRHV
jgi:putative ABC transport system permease protein